MERLPLRPTRRTEVLAPGIAGRGTAGLTVPWSTGMARRVRGAWQPQAADRQAKPNQSEKPRRDPG